MSRILWFVLGLVFGIAALFAGGYVFVRGGGVSMAVSARPLPLEKRVAHMALRASIGPAAARSNPLPLNEQNLLEGAMTYADHCTVCHCAPDKPRTAISKGLFPDPPGLFERKEMVTDDPDGTIYWKVSNGIRLSGMPGFEKTLSEQQRWQVTMLCKHADRISPAVRSALQR
jgi:mono/diheme cytochrome c family protein